MAQVSLVQPDLTEKDLSRGDHIYVWRAGYHHHGIYVGNDKVIHWRGNKDVKKSGIIETSLENFRTGGKENGKYENNGIKRVRYGVTKLDEKLKLTGGTCHTEKCDPVAVTLKRARDALKPENSFQYNGSNYRLLFRNCESFAVYCKLGYEKTSQGEFVMDKVVSKVVLPMLVPKNPINNTFSSVISGVAKDLITGIGGALFAGDEKEKAKEKEKEKETKKSNANKNKGNINKHKENKRDNGKKGNYRSRDKNKHQGSKQQGKRNKQQRNTKRKPK